MSINFHGVLAGIIVFSIGVFGIFKSFKYYKLLKYPQKNLAKTTLISFVFFTIGSIGVIVDSLMEKDLWEIGAIFFTLSYLYVGIPLFKYLSILTPKKEPKKKPLKERVKLPIADAYIIRAPLSRERLEFFLKYSNGILVISRTQKSKWIKKYDMEPDKFIWLSRIEHLDAIDPTKLHVIQDEVLRFIKENKGKCVIYLEGIEYLMLYNNFAAVAKFLFSLKDYTLSNNSLLIVYLPPNIMDTSHEAVLLKEFKLKEEGEIVKEVSEKILAKLLEGEERDGSS